MWVEMASNLNTYKYNLLLPTKDRQLGLTEFDGEIKAKTLAGALHFIKMTLDLEESLTDVFDEDGSLLWAVDHKPTGNINYDDENEPESSTSNVYKSDFNGDAFNVFKNYPF